MTISYQNSQRLILYLGVFSTLLFTVSITFDREVNRIAETLLVISILLSLKKIYSFEKTNSGLWIYLLIPAYLLFMEVINYSASNIYPDLDANHSRFSRHYSRLFLFLFFGWWIIQKPKLIFPIIILFTLAVLSQAATSNEFWNWKGYLNGYRMNFSFSNAQHTGAYAGSLVLLLLALLPKIADLNKVTHKIILTLFVLVSLITAIVICLYSQTRGIWLGLYFALPIMILPWFFKIKMLGALSFTKGLTTYIIFAAFMFLILSQFDLVNKRLNTAVKQIPTFLNNDIENIPNSSAGVRLKQWRLAVQLIKEKPLTGHGGATKELLIRQSSLPGPAKNAFGHFHNSYLELGVAYGIGGILLLLSVIGFLMQRLLLAIRANTISPTFGFFGFSWLVFFVVINIFESYAMFRTGYFLFTIFGGILYGLTAPRSDNIQREIF
jgi:O-antigen ligase